MHNVEQEISRLASGLKNTTGAQKTTTLSSDNTPDKNADNTVSQAQINSFDMASFFGLKTIYEADKNNKNDGGGSGMQTPDVPKDDNNNGAEKGEQDDATKLQDIKDKAIKYFKLTANAIGGQMSAAVKAYNQYNKLFRWAIKNQGGNDNNTENKADTGDNNNKENKTNNDDQKKNNNTKNEKIVGNAIQRLNQAKNREKS